MPETKGRTIEEVIAQFDQPARDSTFALQHQFQKKFQVLRIIFKFIEY